MAERAIGRTAETPVLPLRTDHHSPSFLRNHDQRLQSPSACCVRAAAPALTAYPGASRRHRGYRVQRAREFAAAENAPCAALPVCAEDAADKTTAAVRQPDRAAQQQAW